MVGKPLAAASARDGDAADVVATETGAIPVCSVGICFMALIRHSATRPVSIDDFVFFSRNRLLFVALREAAGTRASVGVWRCGVWRCALGAVARPSVLEAVPVVPLWGVPVIETYRA